MNKESLTEQFTAIAKKYNLFIDPTTIEEIIHLAEIRVIKRSETIRHIGEPATKLGLVLDGILRCYYIDEEGNDITRGFSIKATFCIDEGLFGYPEYICEWETLEDSIIVFFDVKNLKDFINKHNDLEKAYIILLEMALQYKIYRENGFLTENATQRYLHFKKLYPTLCEKVRQHHIATYLGISPESLSRIRKALKDK